MNTSSGPRIDAHRWDFHDGIDLPAPVGAPVHAMADGVVYRAGPADKTGTGRGFGSTHVILQVVDPRDGKNDLFLVYLHLDSIAEGVIPGAQVNQGDLIGAVGQEDAEYPHLHFEFRKGGPEQARSVHPLNYLPYLNTANFTQLRLDRVNFYLDDGEERAVRLCFEAQDRREGDLQVVDVELKGAGVATRNLHVSFDDRNTINSDKGDQAAFKNGIAVEGYQKSNNREQVETAEFPLPTLNAGEKPVNSREGFEDQTFPPQGWALHLLPGNVCRPDEAAALRGSRGLLCQDLQSLRGTLIRAGLRFALPARRLFRERIDVDEGEIFRDGPVRWELELLRLGTRQTTALLRLDNNVVARINGDTTSLEPDTGCVGILHRRSGLQITLYVDQLFLTEAPR
jgi:hypothetical protein